MSFLMKTLQRCLSGSLIGGQTIWPQFCHHTWIPSDSRLLRHVHSGAWKHKIAAAATTPAAYSGDRPQLEEGYEEVEVELPPDCPGCGVRLQQEDPNGPG